MSKKLVLHADRLFPADPAVRAIARRLYGAVQNLPIISPHGHTDPRLVCGQRAFQQRRRAAARRPITTCIGCSTARACRLRAWACRAATDAVRVADPARCVAAVRQRNFHLFRGTPSSLWLSHVFTDVFGLEVVLDEKTADHYFDVIGAALATEAFRPRALFERFNIEVLATTEVAARSRSRTIADDS